MNDCWKFITQLSHKVGYHKLFRWFRLGLICSLGLMLLVAWQQPVSAGSNITLPDSYPRIANYFLDPTISRSEAEQLARWDMVIVGFETHYLNAEAFSIMKQANPNIVILAYVTSEEVPLKHLAITDAANPIYQLYHRLSDHDDWFLKNTTGEYLNFYPETRLINVTTAWRKQLPKFMTNKIIKKNPQHWDGIFYDNCFNNIAWVDDKIDLDQNGQADNWQATDAAWQRAMATMMKQTRQRNPSAVVLCNSSGNFYTYLNGRMIEAFPSTFDGGWSGAMTKYNDVLKQAVRPRIVIVNTVANSTDAGNYQLMRYNLTSTLLGDGFASFDQAVDSHSSLWWYDEYNLALGKPLGGPYNIKNPAASASNWSESVWRRNFERGIVLVNSSAASQLVMLEDGFEKILGTQDTKTNNGKIVGSVNLPAHDGIILQGRIAQVSDAPYRNGTFAKVFSYRGKEVRNSFFTYNSAYSGGDTVVYLSDIETTVVAGVTYVTVYRGAGQAGQVARFAPYGVQYTGGVNIAVDRLDGATKGYRIVTGTQANAPHVRIFSLRGALLNPGCFPYGENFNGGVNVAIGDVLPQNRGQEIIVGAGEGGGPQVRLLDRECKIVSSGFFAYDAFLRSGVAVAAGDVNNDGQDDIITIPGKGGAPYVRIFNGHGKELRPGFYAFDRNQTSGAQLAVSDVDDNGKNEIVAMSFAIFNE